MDFFRDLTLYNFIRGPLVYIAFIVFIGGSIYRVKSLIDAAKREKVVLPFIDSKFVRRSYFHWLIPFNSVNWRRRWGMTTATFLFHFGIVILPFFVLAHVALIYESWGLSWWTFPESFTDFMTLIVVICGVFFFFRRVFSPEVRFVSFDSDHLVLLVAFLPFLTGFLAYHQVLLPHKSMVMLHMFFGEIMLMAIPFTRLAHMFYFFLTRAWIGSQFGLWSSRDY